MFYKSKTDINPLVLSLFGFGVQKMGPNAGYRGPVGLLEINPERQAAAIYENLRRPKLIDRVVYSSPILLTPSCTPFDDSGFHGP